MINTEHISARYTPSHAAVADAMMVVQAKMLEPILAKQQIYNAYIGEQNHPDLRRQRWGVALENFSQSKCMKNSLYALYYLQTKYSDLFPGLLLLTTHMDLHNPDYLYHSFFLAQDKDKMWFAGSPANHTISRSVSPLIDIIHDSSLPELMQKIFQSEGGLWPSPEFIHQQFSLSTYQSPYVEKVNNQPFLNYLTAEINENKEETSYRASQEIGYPLLTHL